MLHRSCVSGFLKPQSWYILMVFSDTKGRLCPSSNFPPIFLMVNFVKLPEVLPNPTGFKLSSYLSHGKFCQTSWGTSKLRFLFSVSSFVSKLNIRNWKPCVCDHGAWCSKSSNSCCIVISNATAFSLQCWKIFVKIFHGIEDRKFSSSPKQKTENWKPSIANHESNATFWYVRYLSVVWVAVSHCTPIAGNWCLLVAKQNFSVSL